MVVQAQEEIGEGSVNLTDPHHTPIITQPSSSQSQKKHKSRRPEEKVTQNTKNAQAQEITSLKKRVKKLEKKIGSRTYKLKRLYKVGRYARIVSFDEACLGDQEDASKQGRIIDDIDKDAEITLIDETRGRHDDDIMFDVGDHAGEEVFVAEQGVPDSKKDDDVQVNTAATTVSTASTMPVSAATITEDEITLDQALPGESITTTTTTTTIPSMDKGKGIMVEQPLKMKKKDQINFDEQEAIRLQVEFDEEIDADYQLAQRLQAQEQEELTIEKMAKLFVQLLEARKKHFATKRLEEKRSIPLTKAQQRSIIETREESSSKRAGDELEQEKVKNQKMDEDKEIAELQSLMKVIPDEEEVAVDAIPLATKPPSIVNFKILKEGNINYYQIIRADGSLKRYSPFIQMLRSFDREDLETL
ncbi:hypothetical protein Tco_1234834 [Tanacetum coccineum]